MNSAPTSRKVLFGPFELDASSGELRKRGRKVRLPEQAIQILSMLVDKPAQIVTREEIRRRLWPNGTVVEFEYGINAAIKKLRLALGDSAEKPRYVETIPRRGYRLIVPIERQQSDSPPTPHPDQTSDSELRAGNLTGRRIWHYRVLNIIGGGAMGLVYGAEDLKLNRRVALKFLPDELTKEPLAIERLRREARAASGLNHPNICTVHAIEEESGHPFIVMELLEGSTLRDRIARVPLSVGETIDFGIQIAEALQAAHEQGIIHRDIKPANIFITTRQQVKILDFGVAKVVRYSGVPELQDALGGGARPDAEHLTRADLTKTGVAMGTAAYMSPEQVRGEELDCRTDLFSFGLVLYEMVTGRQAFEQATVTLLRDAILNRSPAPVRQLKPGTPAALVQIIDKAIQKDRRCRYQSAAQIRNDLVRLSRHESPLWRRDLRGFAGAATFMRSRKPVFTPLQLDGALVANMKRTLEDLIRRLSSCQLVVSSLIRKSSSTLVRRWLWAGAAAGFLAAAMAVWFLARRGPPHQPLQVTRLTFDARLALDPAISADGKYMAYASDRGGSGDIHIWLQELPAGQPVRLTKDEANEDYPAFSPDGTKIAFHSDRDGGGIYVVPPLGGAPRLLAPQGTWPRYSPDGRLILFIPQEVELAGWEAASHEFLIPAEGGERRPVQMPTPVGSVNWHHHSTPVFSPDGHQLLYFSETGPWVGEVSMAWYIVPVGRGPIVRADIPAHAATYGPNRETPVPLAWLRGNRILYWASSGDAINLWLATLSAQHWHLTKPPDQLTFGPGEITSASVSNSGTVVFGSTMAQTLLWSVPLGRRKSRTEADLVALPSSGEINYFPSLSDTGKMAYLSQKLGKRNWNVWLRDLSSGKQTWLANANGNWLVSTLINRAGSRVAYTTCADDLSRCEILTVAASGGAPSRVCENCGMLRSWSSNGAVMASQERIPEGPSCTGYRINRIETATGRKTVLVEKPDTFLFAPDLSPDGRWIVFHARPGPVTDFEQLFVAPVGENVPAAPSRWIAVTDLQHFDADPQWSRDGRMVYFTSNRDGSGTCLWAVRLDPVTKGPVGRPFAVRHFHGNPRVKLYPTFSVAPDRIVISLDQVQSDLWMMHLPEEH
jgi:eukaryotic-like serine/threonine-protein kinase